MEQKLRVVLEPKAPPHTAELYDYESTVEGVAHFSGVDAAALERYRSEGFLLVREAFSAVEVAAAKENLLELGLSEAPATDAIYYEGAIRDLLPDFGDATPAPNGRHFEDLALGKTDDRLPSLDPDTRLRYLRKFMGFARRNPALLAIAEHADLMGVLGRILGEAPELYQDMAMIKPPGGREKPWHQDRAYFNLNQETPVAAAWIALDAATPENGCLRLAPGTHVEGACPHFLRRDWQICDTEVPSRRVAAPMAPGDCLFFDALLPHGTPLNETSQRRWALQFHYTSVAPQPTSDAERLTVFGSEGKGVSC